MLASIGSRNAAGDGVTDAPLESDKPSWRDVIRLTPASAFKIRAARWAWEGRMPVGELTLIPGREGVGKSTFLAWMASAITNGNLPGRFEGQPRAVLYAATEDSWEYTIAPRLLAAGANLDMVFRIEVAAEDGSRSGLILPRDCHHLPDIAHDVNAAALMCDPIMSMVDDRLSNFKAQELRRALEPLKKYAEKAGIAVPALVHFNKGTTADVSTLIAGARAWAEVARAVIGIAVDLEQEDYTCIVSQVKNNLGRRNLPNLTYTIDDVTLETDEGEEAHVGRLRWTGETDKSVEDVLASAMSGDDRRSGEAFKNVVAYVVDEAVKRQREISTADIIAAFDDELKGDHVRKILSRATARGSLVSSMRGFYAGPIGAGDGVSQTGSAPNDARSTPTVTVSQVSLTQVRGDVTPPMDLVTRPLSHVVQATRDTCDGVTVGYGGVPNCTRCGFHPNSVGHFENCMEDAA